MSHSIIFIGQQPGYEKLNSRQPNNLFSCYILRELPSRIYSSFIPPVLGEYSRKVYVDLIGPILAVFILDIILHYGHANKHHDAVVGISPSFVLFVYSLFMPIVCFIIAKLGKSDLSPTECISLIGYGLYGHILTVGISYFLDSKGTNYFFFLFMAIFGGLSALRIIIVLLMTIPKPAARLIVCSFIGIINFIFLMFVHFSFMHKTFKYGIRS